MVKKDERKLKQTKKKKTQDSDAINHINEQESTKQSGIFSALDIIDTKSKEATRVIEEKLKAGLIKHEKSEKVKEIKKSVDDLNKTKKKIENLRKIKKEHNDNGRFEEAIEISNKIITLAFSNNLKEILNQEKKFLDLIKKNRNRELETKSIISSERETEKIDLRLEITGHDKLNKQKKEKFEEENRRLVEEREVFKQEKQELEAEKEALQWEKKMMEEVKKYERDKEKDTLEIDETKKFELEKEEFMREKARFEEQKLEFEEIKRNFHQEKLKFEEQKDTFKWEKEMFEEMKKHEISKEKNIQSKEK
jgi:hypothetical protein